MIWQNPWAWLGIVTLAVPVLIHLLGRGHARVLPFPSLRFLERSRLLPTRRTRIHDLLLLLVRMGILLAAVAALAQPLLLTRGRTHGARQTLARAIVVDTSASMRRPTATGERARDAARRDAVSIASEAQASVVLETSRPADAIAGATDWLARQPGRRELVIISDFQGDALSAGDLSSVPAPVGIRLARIAPTASTAPAETRSRAATGVTIARVATTPEGTDVVWSASGDTSNDSAPLLLTAATETAHAEAASRAAATLSARLPFDSARAIAIVYPAYERRSELRFSSVALGVQWMTAVVARLRSDSLLLAAAANTTSAPASGPADSVGLVIARDAARRPVILAKQATVRGRQRLLLFADVEPGSLASAALIAAVDRARSVAPPLGELDATTLSDRILASWQRPASDQPRAAGPTGASDGRWFWVIALALLGVETWMRRAKRETVVAEVRHDRAA